MLRLSKGEGEFQNTAYWGSIILSTSKGLMQRGVRCAEMGGPSPYLLYTDTDSIFIKSKAVSEEWARQHRIRYDGVEALGKELGQLSSDIDVPKELSNKTVLEPGVIIVALFLAKKIYLCGKFSYESFGICTYVV